MQRVRDHPVLQHWFESIRHPQRVRQQFAVLRLHQHRDVSESAGILITTYMHAVVCTHIHTYTHPCTSCATTTYTSTNISTTQHKHPTTTTTMLMRMILSIVHQRGSSCESESAAVEVLQQRRERAILQRLDEKLPAGSCSQYCFLPVCMYVCICHSCHRLFPPCSKTASESSSTPVTSTSSATGE